MMIQRRILSNTFCETGGEDIHNDLYIYLFFLFILLLCYSKTITADWHFDDIANILLNPPLHIHDLSVETLKKTFFAYPEHPGKFFRPVSNLSFAINWFIGQDRVISYHVFNFSIHFLSTIFLFHTCLLILDTPSVKNKYNHLLGQQKIKICIAALAAIFWAINPVQTQAVTYIVQRMASLAAMFYIIGIWSYLKAKQSFPNKKKAYLYFALTILFYLLAIGSKENAVLLPCSLLLIEIIFFNHTLQINKKNILIFIAIIILITGAVLLLAGDDFFIHLLSSYENRNFTLSQRILTESRIIVYYISLLFYPVPSRLCITHDFQLSTSFLSPQTTIISLVFISVIIILSFIYYKKYPLLSFAILFFLLNHTIESTIIPLELVFEHRNYLPSFFLFLPFAFALGVWICDKKSKIKKTISFSAVLLIIIFLSLGTIIRNQAWLTEKSLWQDSLNKAPGDVRSYINLAHVYLFEEKNYKKAFELNYLSLEKHSATTWKDRLRAYNNMAYIMKLIGNYQKALTFYDRALLAAMEHQDSNLYAIVALSQARLQWFLGKREEAVKTLTELIDSHENQAKLYLYHGEMLIVSGKLLPGIASLHKTLKNASQQSDEYLMALLDLSLAFGRLGSTQKSAFFTRLAQTLGSSPVPTALCFLEHNLRQNRPEKANQAIHVLLSQLSWTKFLSIVNRKSPDYATYPLDYERMNEFVNNWVKLQKINNE